MFAVCLVTYFLIDLVSDSSPIAVNSASLTNLDRLYFKHNRRHKILSHRAWRLGFIANKTSISLPETLHSRYFGVLDAAGGGSEDGWRTNRRGTTVFRALAEPTGFNNGNRDNNAGRNRKNQRRAGGHRDPNRTEDIFDAAKKKRRAKRVEDTEEAEQCEFRGKEELKDEIAGYEELMRQVESLAKSKKKTDKDLYALIMQNIKEESFDPKGKFTAQHFEKQLQKAERDRRASRSETTRQLKRKSARAVRRLIDTDVVLDVPSPVDLNLECKAKEDSCGFRYPIVGSPEEIYDDPNSYKLWGRTPLSQIQTTHSSGVYRGQLDESEKKLEDLIVSRHKEDATKLDAELSAIRSSRFRGRMAAVVRTTAEGAQGQERREAGEDYKYATAQVTNDYETFKKGILEADPYGQDQVLSALNPYNPWDEYTKMKNLKAALPPIRVNYKLDLNNLRVTFRGTQKLPERDAEAFLREYLRHFLVLESDNQLFWEFKNACFLYDILKYFDVHAKIEPEEEKEYFDLVDRAFKFYFPRDCQEGFPKKPKDAEFPVTLDPNRGLMGAIDKTRGQTNTYHRVNMACCLMALARCLPLVREYSSDIFTEQRFKLMLDTIEAGLALELQRLDFGISDIRPANLAYSALCNVDGAFLATLTDVLLQWNIRRGVENILDLTLLLTLKKLDGIEPVHLVKILCNVSHLTTLPENIYVNFLAKVLDFVHERLKSSLVNGVRYMRLEDALDLLGLISRYDGLVTRPLMEAFVQVYRDEIVALGKREPPAASEPDPDAAGASAEELRETQKDRVFALISALQLAGMPEHLHLVDELTNAFSSEDFDLSSAASISVLENFSEADAFQRKVLARTKNNLVRLKYTMFAGSVLRALEGYVRGVAEGRLRADPVFFFAVMSRFAALKAPDSEELVAAARLTDRFARHLSRKQLRELFADLTGAPLYYNFLTRLGLRGEYLDYPIATAARVLYYASKNGVMLQEVGARDAAELEDLLRPREHLQAHPHDRGGPA